MHDAAVQLPGGILPTYLQVSIQGACRNDYQWGLIFHHTDTHGRLARHAAY